MTPSPAAPIDVDALLEELVAARLHSEHSARELTEARTEDTNATNRLNTAQRQFDEWYITQKKDAPYDSDWARKARAG